MGAMTYLRRIASVFLFSSFLVAPALADEGIPADLTEVKAVPTNPTVPPSGGSVAQLVAEAGNPAVPQHIAHARFRELVVLGPAAVAELSSIYNNKKSADLEVWVAARAMGRIGGDQAQATLEKGLESKRVMTRLGAVSGLELIGDASAVPALEKALFDAALMVRAAAADALGKLRVKSSALSLNRALNLPENFRGGNSLFVRRHIVDAMALVGSVQSMPALVEALEDQDTKVQDSARKAVETIGGRSYRVGSSISPEEIESWKKWLRLNM